MLRTIGKHTLAGFFWIAMWTGIALTISTPALLPLPWQIAAEMFSRESLEGVTGGHLGMTMVWTSLSWLLGVSVSTVIALVGQWIPGFATLFKTVWIPFRTLPSVIAVPVFAAMMGADRSAGLACATILVAAYTWPTIEEAVSKVANLSLELSTTLALSPSATVRLVVLPGIAAGVRASSIHGLGIALVVTVAAEMILALPGTAGREIADLAWLLRMRELYANTAWIVILAALVSLASRLIPSALLLPAKRLLRAACLSSPHSS